MKEKRANKNGMMTVRVEGQNKLNAVGPGGKADDATNPEATVHRQLNRHGNDAASHMAIDPMRLELSPNEDRKEGDYEGHKEEEPYPRLESGRHKD